MLNVVFVAPYFVGSTLNCLRLLARMPDVRLGVITQEPRERVPTLAGDGIQGHYQVRDCLDAQQLIAAGQHFQQHWGRVDRLIGFLEQMQIPNAEARDALKIPGMGGEVARNFRDKNRMKAVLQQAGLPVARQRRIEGAADALGFVEQVGYPIVLKPLAGLGSRATMRASSQEELYAALDQLLPSPSNPIQAEEFVQGSEHTFETVTVQGRPVWQSSSYYLPGPLEVLETPWIQYCVLLPREPMPPHAEPFRAINTAALAALGMETGLSHMEWFIRADGSPVISEVGARPPGVHLMPMMGEAHGVDMWAKWLRLMLDGTFEMPERTHATGVAFLRAQGGGRTVTHIEGIQEVQERVGDLIVAAELPRPGQPRSTHYEGEGWVLLKHPDTRRVVEGLRTTITGIRVVAG